MAKKSEEQIECEHDMVVFTELNTEVERLQTILNNADFKTFNGDYTEFEKIKQRITWKITELKTTDEYLKGMQILMTIDTSADEYLNIQRLDKTNLV